MISIRHEELIKAFGNHVRELRKQKGYTMQKLAEEAGIDPRQLSYIELGKVNTTISSIYTIAKALNISISELVKLNGY